MKHKHNIVEDSATIAASNEAFCKRELEASVSLDGIEAVKLLAAIAPTTARDAITKVAQKIATTANLHGWSYKETTDWYSHKISKNTLKYWLLLAGSAALVRK